MYGRPLLCLGTIKRDVGPAKQLLFGIAILRMERDPGPCPDAVADARNIDRCFDPGDQSFPHLPDIVAIVDGSAKNREFIAAQTPHDVAVFDDGLHAGRDRLQNPIPGGMTVLVIDALESIEIEQQQGVGPGAAPVFTTRSRERFHQRSAIRQTRQRIVQRLVARFGGGDFGREPALEFALLLLQPPE